MKLSVWAKKQGISYRTAHRMFQAGTLPVPATQMASGTIILEEASEAVSTQAYIYARVSSHGQGADLDRQVARLVEFALEKGLVVAGVVKDVGSGLNGTRSGLTALLKNPKAGVIVVEHRDRLARFGFDYISASLSAQGRKLVVADDGEVEDDIVRDLHEVIVSMCTRLYGKRSAQNRAKKALEALASE
jgi:predicted site-specific integrase-resolvase